MRKLRIVEFLSADGVMQAPGDPAEDTEGGFRYGGWQRPYFDDDLAATAARSMATTDAYLFGRKTYDKMAAYWPTAPAEDPFAKHLNSTPKYVVSTTLHRVDWRHTTLVTGDVVDEVQKLKGQPGGSIAVLGSGGLVQTLLAGDLIDEYFVTLCPIVLGGGKRLFRDTTPAFGLKLVDCTTTSTGCVMLTYHRGRDNTSQG